MKILTRLPYCGILYINKIDCEVLRMFELIGYMENEKFAKFRCECDRTSVTFVPYSDLEVHTEKYCVLKDNVELICTHCGKKQTEKYIPLEQQTFSHINIPTCPTCGSTNVSKITTTSKVVGFAAVGVFSSNFGKTMHCKQCGYKW